MCDIVGVRCVSLKVPAFTKGKDQLSSLDVDETRKLANLQIHVECVIGLVRQNYSMNSTILIDLLITKYHDNYSSINKVAHVCSSPVNMCKSVLGFD